MVSKTLLAQINSSSIGSLQVWYYTILLPIDVKPVLKTNFQLIGTATNSYPNRFIRCKRFAPLSKAITTYVLD